MDTLELQYGRQISVALGGSQPAAVYGVDGLDLANPTLAAGDVKISKDGGTYVDVAVLPTMVNSVPWLNLSAAELQCKQAHLTFRKSGVIASKDLLITTIGHPAAGRPGGVTSYGVIAGAAASQLTLASDAHADADSVFNGHGVRVRHGGLTVHGAATISATAERVKTTQEATYYIAGLKYTKAAFDNQQFSSAHTINTAQAAGQFWGVFLFQINAAGTVSTKVPSADQVHASESVALAAKPACDSGNIPLFYLTVQSKNNVRWTANTDDLTAGSDCGARTFTQGPLTGTLEEWSEVESYTASTKVAGLSRPLVYLPAPAVAEYWLYGTVLQPTLVEAADVNWTTVIEEAYATAGAEATPAQILYMFLQRLTNVVRSGTTITTKKLDGTTDAFTMEMDDATNPTELLRS